MTQRTTGSAGIRLNSNSSECGDASKREHRCCRLNIMSSRRKVCMTKQPRDVSDRFTLQVALSRASGAKACWSQAERLQTKLSNDCIELATKRVRLQADDEIVVRQPLDVRLEHVNDQPLVEHDVMRSPGPAARKRLVPPKRHNNNAAPPRWQNDSRTQNAESFARAHTSHEHEN